MPDAVYIGWAFYRKKPVVIKALRFTGENWFAFINWSPTITCPDRDTFSHLIIKTLEGEMRAEVGDWIIQGVKSEFYPCKPDIFAATYEDAIIEGNERP